MLLNSPMPAAYSNDLREKVMAASDRGEKKSHVSQMFHISRDTIDRWLKCRTTTGSIQAAQGYQRGHNQRILDWEEFRAFAQTDGDKTQSDMAQLWQGDVSARTMSRALTRVGLSRKKDLRRERERSGSQTSCFRSSTGSNCPIAAGVRGCCFRADTLSENNSMMNHRMDERDDYGYGWCERGKRFEAQRVWTKRRAGKHDCSCEQRLSAPFTIEGARNIEWCLRHGWRNV